MIEFTALSESPCTTSLLQIDETLVLIDPGCDDLLRFKSEGLPHKPDLILLSHADTVHLGGYVYGFRHLGWNTVPIFATLPVVNMGRTAMYDAFRSRLPEDITLADIDDAFDWITSLRYSQATQLSGRCQGITITAHNAGHTLGGTIWKIVRGADHVVYAIDWNHARDQHLNGTSLFSAGQVPEGLARPSILITDANNASLALPARSKRNAALFESITSTVEEGGSVLIPIDASTRSLELCEMLENHWDSAEGIRTTPVYFLSHSNTKTIGYARSMLEWMSEKMINQYGSSGGLFDFKHVKLLSKPSQIKTLPVGPKVILATSYDLENGFSQSILQNEIMNKSSNLIILTQKTMYSPNSLAGELMQSWTRQTATTGTELPEFVALDLHYRIKIRRQVPLTGQELKDHTKKEQERKDEELARATVEERNRNILDAEDSESEDEDERAALIASRSLDSRGPSSLLSLGSSALLSTSFDLFLDDPQIAKLPPRLKTFPFVEKRRRFDDYGEILRNDEFKRADEEEKEIESTFTATNKGAITTGKKRKWGEVANSNGLADTLEDQVDDRAVPSKLSISEEDIHITCRMRYIDLEGLHDGTSLKNIVESVNPRKLVLIHASDAEKAEMKTACEKMKNFTQAIVIPVTMATIDISLDTSAFDVRLSDAFTESLSWQKLYEQEVAHVTGKIMPASSDSADLSVVDILSSKADLGMIPRLQALFVGDIRLADLRKLLMERGHTAELRGGGVLFCDGCVAVTKASAGELMLEGHGSENFYSVRESVYQSLAIVES